MKKIMRNLILLLIISLCSFSSCDKPQNDDLSVNPFIGKWELNSLMGGFSPTESFQENEILWVFNADESLIMTINKELSNLSRMPVKIDTIVSYSYSTIDISIGTFEYEYQLEGKTLKLFDNLASDGFMLEFEKK